MSVLGATLTLPGIAGIVLTIGMAVDSNVLIYERIREEARLGPIAGLGDRRGLRRARSPPSSIRTSRMLIAAMVLFFLGSGPVRGFAVTLHPRHPDDRLHRRHADAPDDRDLVSRHAARNASPIA